jgi:predicted Zn-dependent peptidase
MQSTRLANGVRVVSETLADLPSVTAGIWVENGSRYERPEQAGISHFLEHLFLQGHGAPHRRRIAEEMDAVGGVLNAFTGKEYTCYYAKVLREHLPMALDLLRRHLHALDVPAEEVDASARRHPGDLAGRGHARRLRPRALQRAFWPDHPLRAADRRHADTVSALHREHFLAFLDARYRPDRILITAAGNVTHDAAARASRAAASAAWRHGRAVDGVPPTRAGGVDVHEKDLEQVHLCLGPRRDRAHRRERYAAAPPQHGARRRHEHRALPGDPRAPRQGVHRVIVPLVVPRRGLRRHVRRHEPRSGCWSVVEIIRAEQRGRRARASPRASLARR